jgi:hypothetical protein
MKQIQLLLSIILLAALIASCSPKNAPQDLSATVAVILTQTAAAAPTAAKPIPTATQIPEGTITGTVSLAIVETPAMNVYAQDPATGKWAMAQTTGSKGEGKFSLTVPPGTYLLFAYMNAEIFSAYFTDDLALAKVTVAAGQTVADITLRFPGSGDCGVRVGLPASPDGLYPAVPGATAECLANLKATQEAEGMVGPIVAKDQPIRFATGPMAVEVSGTVISGQRDRYTFPALQGENMIVTVSSQERNAVFTILGPDNVPLQGTEEGEDTTDWAGSAEAEGTYAILVGPTRGSTTYTLKVNVSGPQ